MTSLFFSSKDIQCKVSTSTVGPTLDCSLGTSRERTRDSLDSSSPKNGACCCETQYHTLLSIVRTKNFSNNQNHCKGSAKVQKLIPLMVPHQSKCLTKISPNGEYLNQILTPPTIKPSEEVSSCFMSN